MKPFNKRMRSVAAAVLLTFAVSLSALPCSGYAAEQDDVLITASYQRTPLDLVLDNLSRVSGVNIVVNGDLKKEVTMRFDNKNFGQIMTMLGTAFNFNWVSTPNGVLVSPAETMTITKTLKIRYADPEEIKDKFTLFIPKEKVSVNKSSGTISIETTPTNIAKAEQILANDDVPIKQIMIYAQMIEVSKSDSSKIGFDYNWNEYDSTKSWKFAYTITGKAESIFSNATVLARPSIATLNGNKAKIDLATKYPVISTTTANGQTTSDVKYEDIGVILTVEPRVNEDPSGEEFITMKLNPEVSVLTGKVEKPNITAPEISKRAAETLVRVRNGETIIIGGLMKTDELESISGIPFLRNMPIFGKLFTTTTKQKKESEIFIMVTPVIQK